MDNSQVRIEGHFSEAHDSLRCQYPQQVLVAACFPCENNSTLYELHTSLHSEHVLKSFGICQSCMRPSQRNGVEFEDHWCCWHWHPCAGKQLVLQGTRIAPLGCSSREHLSFQTLSSDFTSTSNITHRLISPLASLSKCGRTRLTRRPYSSTLQTIRPPLSLWQSSLISKPSASRKRSK